jgi:hypothetical protein
MHDHKKENLEMQVIKLQAIVDFYRDDWKAMIRQLEDAETRADHWYEECKKLTNEKCEKLLAFSNDADRWHRTAEVLARELGKVEYAEAEYQNQEDVKV